MGKKENTEKQFQTTANKNSLNTINSVSLFGDNNYVYIEHDGQKYILRITRENKLILTK